MTGVSEDDCVVCGHWPAADRRSMRLLIDTLPMREEVCDRCLMRDGVLAQLHRAAPAP